MKTVQTEHELEIGSNREERTAGLYIEDENGNVFDEIVVIAEFTWVGL